MTYRQRTNPEGLCTRCGNSGLDPDTVSPCGYDELFREVWLCFDCVDEVIDERQ